MIRFYNTLHRKIEEFKPISEGTVKLYTCGPTVYNYAHIGNLRAYVFEDLLRRFLEYSGYEVIHVMNLTDIDDKTIRRSMEEGLSLKSFTDGYIESFYEDIETLNIKKAHHYPRATEFIPQMVEMVQKLEEKKHAYVADDGSVFFKISSFPDYGKLTNLKLEDLRVGQRVENDEYEKEEMRDFALWKGAKADEGDIYWDSPWGPGRPGWHIECSVMSTYYLGTHFDIHCGGVDNIFPHHENEIAQSCAASGDRFVNYWLHNEHLIVNGQKMSKSLNNFYTLRDLLDKNLSPEAIRYTLLSTHYRQKLNFTFESVSDSQKSINRLRELKRRLSLVENIEGDNLEESTSRLYHDFTQKLGSDLNISGALGALFTWVSSVFVLLDKQQLSKDGAVRGLKALETLDHILGVIEEKNPSLDTEIETLIKKREEARSAKNWSLADEIRGKLANMGIILEDTPKGTVWKRGT
ncbi:MAG: cysteine--tRNA ligase [FCB group bacterium]|nr:cysteine--tRNA ligase [FCB group bacterium]